MTPKALSSEELQEENEYLVHKINVLEKEIYWNRVGMTVATILWAVIVWIRSIN